MKRYSWNGNDASILIISVFLITFMSLLAVFYLNAMTEFRGAGLQNARNFLSDLGVKQGESHALRVLQAYAIDVDPDSSDYVANFASSWRMEFQSDLSLEPGGVAPDRAYPEMNVPVIGSTVVGVPTGWPPHSDIFKYSDGMTQPFSIRTGMGYEDVNKGVWTDSQSARYFDAGLYDSHFVETTDITKARYKLRYAVMIFDINGNHAMNFYPEREYTNDELNADLNGDGNAGDRRREFAYLRDRYAAAISAIVGEVNVYDRLQNQYVKRNGDTDPYEAAYDFHLRGLRSQIKNQGRGDGVSWFSDAADPMQFRHYLPIVSKWPEVEKIAGVGNWVIGGTYSVAMQYAYQSHGYQWSPAGTIQYRHPGPMYSYDAKNYTASAWSDWAAGNQEYTPFGEQLSRRRGDDVDCPYYYNILTAHDKTLFKVFSSTASELVWSIYSNEYRPDSLDSTGFGRAKNFPLDLLPYVRGLPFEMDDNYDRLSHVWDSEYFNIAGDSVAVDDHDADPTTESIPRPEYKSQSWYENVREMKQQFYGLRGVEGKAIGPRLTLSNQISARNDNIVTHSPWGSSDIVALDRDVVQEHYVWDVMDALSMAVAGARKAWSGDAQPSYSSSINMTDWDARANLRDTYYRDIHAIHRRFLNNLGEDIAVNAPAPDATQLRPENWRAGNGLLAGYTLERPAGTPSNQGGDNNWLVARSLVGDNFTDIRAVSGHPEFHRLPAGVHTAGMERLLNDVRMSFFGSQYVDETGAVQPIPALDFNHDGFAESSYNGFNDGTVPKPTAIEYTNNGPRPWRHLSADAANPFHPFLAKKSYFPDRPFSSVGRLFMGKSHYFRVLVRGQLWDLEKYKKASEQNLDFVYVVNPSDNPTTVQLEDPVMGGAVDLSDSHILYKQAVINNSFNGQSGVGQ